MRFQLKTKLAWNLRSHFNALRKVRIPKRNGCPACLTARTFSPLRKSALGNILSKLLLINECRASSYFIAECLFSDVSRIRTKHGSGTAFTIRLFASFTCSAIAWQVQAWAGHRFPYF